MEKRLICIVAVFLAALLFSSPSPGRAVPSPFPDAEAVHFSEPSPSVPSSPYPTASPLPSSSPSPVPTPTPAPYEGEAIAQYALQFEGARYNYGGMDPSTGFDCSGLVYYVFRQFGYRLNRVAADQALNGTEIKAKEDLLPGDIICFSWITNAAINHVGIYLGDGKFIHAMDSAHDVIVTELEEYLETHRCYLRRIVGVEEKLPLSVIQERERQDAEALAYRMAEEERIAAEQAKYASPSPTPPPAFIPDAGAIAKAEAEKQHRKEIEEAWRTIWEEETPASADNTPPGEEPASAGTEDAAPPELPASSENSESEPATDSPPASPPSGSQDSAAESDLSQDTASGSDAEPEDADSVFNGTGIIISA